MSARIPSADTPASSARTTRPRAAVLFSGLFAVIALQITASVLIRGGDASSGPDAVWRDPETGLGWYAPPVPRGASYRTALSYERARDFCGSLEVDAAATGLWRLPSAREVAVAAGHGAADHVPSDPAWPGNERDRSGPWYWCEETGWMTRFGGGEGTPGSRQVGAWMWASLSTGKRWPVAMHTSSGHYRLICQEVVCVREYPDKS